MMPELREGLFFTYFSFKDFLSVDDPKMNTRENMCVSMCECEHVCEHVNVLEHMYMSV